MSHCPSDTQLAGYADGRLDESARAALEAHAATCEDCLDTLALLGRTGDENALPAPPELMARAESVMIAPHARPASVKRWLPSLGIAATLALLVWYGIPARSPVADAPLERGRSVAPPISGPRILGPADGETRAPGDLPVRWTPVAGALFYDVSLLDPEGDVLWAQRTSETVAAVPADARPARGAAFLRVTASLGDGHELSSSVLEVRTSDPRMER